MTAVFRALLLMLLAPGLARAATFTTSDGVRLHYTDTGPRHPAHVLVFVPGWLMPGWIFAPQVAAFARRDRVVVLDPRGQGASAIAPGGYTAARRGQDIAELLARLGPGRVVLIGWSLGGLDALAYVHAHGDARLAGLVLIDNSVGEPPPPEYHPAVGPAPPHAVAVAAFVRGMFRTKRPAAYLDRLTRAALRLPAPEARDLRAYDEPRDFWRTAAEGLRVPLLYVVRPWLAAQAANLRAARPATEVVLFPDSGHALFVDRAARFDRVLARFLNRLPR
ncbi:MAG: alpha/beta hydrolase [Rhodospirillales bacterium]|nr:alpha/beta hydrolase [Rhodospirillales bacterium]